MHCLYLMPFIQLDSLAAAHVLHTWMRKKKRGREKETKICAQISSNLTRLLVYFPLYLHPFSPPFHLFLFSTTSSSSCSPSPGVFLRGNASVPQFEEAVPGSCADAHAILGDAGAAHPVVVAGEHTWKRRERKEMLWKRKQRAMKSKERIKGEEKGERRG